MTLEHVADPTAPTCERCGAVVHDPCATEEKQKGCQLPDFCFPNGRSQRSPYAWAEPTPEMLDGDPLFEAIWQTIKTWDVNVPAVYDGYCGATGNHARAIYDAVKPHSQS